MVRKALAGACAVREAGDADAVGGVVPSFVASPGSTSETSAVLRAAAEHELAVVARGSGGRLGWGTPPARCDLVVDMLRMDQVTEHAAGDLVAKVQAGTSMGRLAEVLATAGQQVALDAPAGATVGGVIATGLAGPRRLRYGTPRDLLIGITVVRADGTVAHSGGKVVKNVAGYDLGKLFAGSFGTLGLVTEATFRLHPLPPARAFVTAEFGPAATTEAMASAVASAAGSPLVPSAVEVSLGRTPQAGVLLEGSADGVAERAGLMAELLGSAGAAGTTVSDAEPEWWGAPLAGAGGGTLVRIAFWVAALDRVLGAIRSAAQRAGIRPAVGGPAGAGALYADLEPGTGPAAAAGFVAALRETLADARGSVVVLTAPAEVRAALHGAGGMHGPVPSLNLMRAIKDQFDPGHRMAPGRFPEGVS
ncbi:MAG: FAD-binding oxidoreductase [Streptosporangiaceae bacterium]|nr:FAD-binding oxidoreductase [Streptosporangiaceae bacterium]